MNFKTGDKVIYLSGIDNMSIETVAHATKTFCYLVGGPQKYRQSTGDLIEKYGMMIKPKIRHPEPGEIEKLEKEAELISKAVPVYEKLKKLSWIFHKNALSYSLAEVETIGKKVDELERLVKK